MFKIIKLCCNLVVVEFEIHELVFINKPEPSGTTDRFCYPPAGNCMFKVNNRNTRTRCEIWSKLTIKIPKRHQWRRSGIFIVNFEHI